MASAAIVASFLGRSGEVLRRGIALGVPHCVGRLVAVDVTVHAPAHVERRELEDPTHALYLAVAALAGNSRIDVTHVREVHVLGNFVDADPLDRFLRIAVSVGVGVDELLELRALTCRRAIDLWPVWSDL